MPACHALELTDKEKALIGSICSLCDAANAAKNLQDSDRDRVRSTLLSRMNGLLLELEDSSQKMLFAASAK